MTKTWFTWLMIVVLIGVLCIIHIILAGQFGLTVANIAVWGILALQALGYLFGIIVPLWNGKAKGEVSISGWRQFAISAWYSNVPWGKGYSWDLYFRDTPRYSNICFLGTCIWLCLHALPLVAVYLFLIVLWRYLIVVPLWKWLIMGLIVNIIWDRWLKWLSHWLKSGVGGVDWIPKWVFGVIVLLLACYIHPTSRMILAPIMVWLFKWPIHWLLVLAGVVGLIMLLCICWDDLVAFMENPDSSQWGKFLFWFVPTFILLWVLSPFAFYYWDTVSALLAMGCLVFVMLGFVVGKGFVDKLWDWPRVYRPRDLIGSLMLAYGSFAIAGLLFLCLYLISEEVASISGLFGGTMIALLSIVSGLVVLLVAIRSLLLLASRYDERKAVVQKATKKKVVVVERSATARRARRILSPLEKTVRWMVGWLFALSFWMLAYAGFDLIPYEVNKELGMVFFTVFLLLAITPCRETAGSIWRALVVAPLKALWRYGLQPLLVTLTDWAKDKEEGLCPLVKPVIKH